MPSHPVHLPATAGLTYVGAANSPGGNHHGAAIPVSSVNGPVSPLSTLVGSSSGLEINLQWDASVRNSANWATIEAGIAKAAKLMTDSFSNHVVLNIAVGLGEVGGYSMGSGSLGESLSNGYITKFSTVSNALLQADGGLITSNVLTAFSSPTLGNFFVPSAEAKALGIISPIGSGIDGYIGIGKSSSITFSGTVGANQYDGLGIAIHEITEVMGRIGMEGSNLGGYRNVFTPLDLFRYSGNGVRSLSEASAYFSLDGGHTSLGTYNNGANGGDSTDWASLSMNANDALDAFGSTGGVAHLTHNDFVEVQSLGYSQSLVGIPSSTVLI